MSDFDLSACGLALPWINQDSSVRALSPWTKPPLPTLIHHGCDPVMAKSGTSAVVDPHSSGTSSPAKTQDVLCPGSQPLPGHPLSS